MTRSRNQHWTWLSLVFLVVAACAAPTTTPSSTSSSSSASAPAAQRSGPKRVVAAIYGEPNSIISRMNTAQVSVPGAGAVEQLANAGLGDVDADGKIRPQLAEAIPSTENGLWKLLPDGKMETTWKIKENAKWHDGRPVTAEDFVFTTTVDQDPDLAILRNAGYQAVETVLAPDPRTILVRWSKPYIDADTMFTSMSTVAFGLPLPKHLLEEGYQGDKTNFLAMPYWTRDYVGTGAFRVTEFVPGSYVALRANENYIFGKPKIDEFEVKFILDQNIIITNLLTGGIDMTLGRGFSIEQVFQTRDLWPNGTAQVTPRSWIVIHPQFMNPTPTLVGDVRFRRAMMHATDRQQLMDTLEGGFTAVAHAYLSPAEPEYNEVHDAAVRYEYDQRKAAQMIEELGYSKGPDGFYRDGASQRLNIEMRTYGIRVSDDATVSIADAWTRFGVATDPTFVPPQRITDREYMATFPSFLMYRQPNSASDLGRLRGALAPTAETRFVGSNYARYVDAEFDGLIDKFLTTIPRPERMQVLRDAIRHISENLNLMGLFYDAEIGFLNNRLQNITARETRLWDIQNWDTK